MNLDKDSIENILYTIPDTVGIMDKLSPQEVLRLVDLFSSVLQSLPPVQNNDSWLNIANTELKKNLANEKVFYMISNLDDVIDIKEFLRIFVNFELKLSNIK